MNFYYQHHSFYCGIDLHPRSMQVCILDQMGKKVVHRKIETNAEDFLKLIEPYRGDIVVGVECMFSWYWRADLCAEHKVTFS